MSKVKNGNMGLLAFSFEDHFDKELVRVLVYGIRDGRARSESKPRALESDSRAKILN